MSTSPSNEWSCEACTVLNLATENPLFCGLCFAWRDDITTWGCSSCSFQNSFSRSTCAMCKSKRQSVLGKRNSREIDDLRDHWGASRKGPKKSGSTSSGTITIARASSAPTKTQPSVITSASTNPEADWSSHLAALQQYVRMCGHCVVGQEYVTPDSNIKLGEWLRRQRMLARAGKLSVTQRNELDVLNALENETELRSSGPAATGNLTLKSAEISPKIQPCPTPTSSKTVVPKKKDSARSIIHPDDNAAAPLLRKEVSEEMKSEVSELSIGERTALVVDLQRELYKTQVSRLHALWDRAEI